MPIYEYRCRKCGRIFSVLQKVGAAEKNTSCTECGSRDVKKMLSSFACSFSDSGHSSAAASHRSHGGG